MLLVLLLRWLPASVAGNGPRQMCQAIHNPNKTMLLGGVCQEGGVGGRVFVLPHADKEGR